jgi:RNA polymerase sigma-70 factor (ECF subfamily)
VQTIDRDQGGMTGRQMEAPSAQRHEGRSPATSAAESFGEEIEALLPHLRRYARSLTRNRATADDLVQEALIRAIEKIHRWQQGTNLRAWLVAVLHNLYVDGMRRVAREGAAIRSADLAHLEPAFAHPPHQAASLRLRDLQRALAKLPEEQRSVVVLVGLEGKEYRTVATLLDLPIGTVRSRLSRGRNALRELTDGT